MNFNSPVFQRALLAVPLVFAMLCHAIALDRWLLVIPAMVGLMFVILRSADWNTTSRHWYIVIGGGLLAGLVVPAAEVPAGPLPPAAAAALTGVAIAIALFAVYTGKITVAWAAGWALVTITGELQFRGVLRFALFAFLITSLLAAAWHARLVRNRLREWLVLGLFLGMLGIATAGVAGLVQRLDQVFLDSVQNFAANNSASARTGLGNSLTLNAKSTITPSMEPLLELSEMTGFLRAKVMDEFDGAQWTTSSKLMAETTQASTTSDRSIDHREIELIFLDVMDYSIPSPAGTNSVQNAESTVRGGWIIRGKPEGVSVLLGGNARESLVKERIDETEYLDIPDELKIGLAPFAQELSAQANSNLEKAESIAKFFQENFKYSLTTDLAGDSHPLVTLVEKRRPAYCVYFASAMAVMLRSQNVPTRIVTGFVPGETNPLSGKVIVRGRDTHAWVEVWSPEEERFVAFDPTPSSSRRQLMGHDDPVNYFTAFIGAFRSAMRRIWLLLKYQPSTGMVALIMSPLFWIAIGVILVVIVKRRFGRTSVPRTGKSTSVDPLVEAIYRRYVSSLQKAGVSPLASETDDELLVRLEALENQPLLEAAKAFLSRYRAVRFGAQTSGTDGELEELAKLNVNGADPT